MNAQKLKEVKEAIKAEREASDAYVRLLEAEIAELRAAVAAAVLAERERCAVIADNEMDSHIAIAAAIRAQVTP